LASITTTTSTTTMRPTTCMTPWQVREHLCGMLGEDVLAVHAASASQRKEYVKLLADRDEALVKVRVYACGP
jgi:hypothetical protein